MQSYREMTSAQLAQTLRRHAADGPTRIRRLDLELLVSATMDWTIGRYRDQLVDAHTLLLIACTDWKASGRLTPRIWKGTHGGLLALALAYDRLGNIQLKRCKRPVKGGTCNQGLDAMGRCETHGARIS